jgi:hypothetical protein
MFVTESFAAVPDGGLRVAAGGIFIVPKIQARVSHIFQFRSFSAIEF